MLQDEFASVLAVESRDQLLAELVGFAGRLGFEKVGAIAVVDRSGPDSSFYAINNALPAYRELSGDPDKGRRDPVMQHCKRASVPIAWSQDTYVAAGQGAKWEEQAPHGYCTGICFAMHLPNGLHFLVGVNRDQ